MLHRRANNNCKVVLRWIPERKLKKDIPSPHDERTETKKKNSDRTEQNRKTVTLTIRTERN